MKFKYRNILLCLIMVCSFAFLVGYKTNKQMPIFCVNTKNNEVAITFDINWAEEDYTKQILEVLEQHNVKATFFIMGKWIKYPSTNISTFEEIYKNGHEIGNHSYVHPMFSKISKERIEKEINDTNKIIKDITGEDPRLFRFPSGDFNNLAINVIKNLGMYPIQWNIDSIDWKNVGEDVEFKRVKDKIKPGSIILYHNNGKHTPKNLDKLLTYLEKENYTIKTVGKMIFRENYIIDKDGLQISE